LLKKSCVLLSSDVSGLQKLNTSIQRRTVASDVTSTAPTWVTHQPTRNSRVTAPHQPPASRGVCMMSRAVQVGTLHNRFLIHLNSFTRISLYPLSNLNLTC
jgi:hypothetical protein